MAISIEQEILDKFRQLDKASQQRVQALIDAEMVQAESAHTFDYEAWFQKMEAVRDEIKGAHAGVFPPIAVVDMLRDIRDGEDE